MDTSNQRVVLRRYVAASDAEALTAHQAAHLGMVDRRGPQAATA
jgi:hypothetical protein